MKNSVIVVCTKCGTRNRIPDFADSQKRCLCGKCKTPLPNVTKVSDKKDERRAIPRPVWTDNQEYVETDKTAATTSESDSESEDDWTPSPKVANEIWLILAILALAAFLRIFGLGSESLWLDETYTASVSQTSPVAIIKSCIIGDTHPPLYYLLLHFWMLLFGQNEVAIRSLSACFGIMSVFILYKVGRELFNRQVGLIAALLLAISAFSITVSQDARAYSLLQLLTVSSFLLFIRVIRYNRHRRKLVFVFYTLVNVLLCYTHLYGLFVLASQIFYFALFHRKYCKAALAFWAAQAVTIATFSPWIFVMFTHTFGAGIHGLEWIPRPTYMSVLSALSAFTGSGPFLFLAFLLLCLSGLVYFVKGAPHTQLVDRAVHKSGRLSIKVSIKEHKTALLLLWFFLPLAFSLVLSIIVKPIFQAKYLIEITPALYLLASRGIDNINSIAKMYIARANVALIIVVIVVLLSIPGLNYINQHPHGEQWKDVANLIKEESKPNDAVVIYPETYLLPFNHYYKGEPRQVLSSQDVIEDPESMSSKDRLWLVLMTYETTRDAPIKQDLFTRYGNDSLLLEKEFSLITIYLFDIR